MNQTQQLQYLVNTLFCYEGEAHTGNDSEKQHFLQHKGNHNNKDGKIKESVEVVQQVNVKLFSFLTQPLIF